MTDLVEPAFFLRRGPINWHRLLKRRDGAPDADSGGDRRWQRRELQQLLELERARFERSGTPFVLVVFRFPDNRSPAAAECRRLIATRIRSVDHAGRMEPGAPAVILTNTTLTGAEVFAAGVLEGMDACARPAVDYFVCPERPADSPRDTDNRKEHDADDGIPATGSAGEHAGSPGVGQEQEDAAPVLQVAAGGGLTWPVLRTFPDVSVRPVSDLLVRPLPGWKRSVDVGASAVGLLLLLPLLLVVAAVIKATSRGPVLFVQQRSGLGGRPFAMFKFRTMCADAEQQKSALRRFSEQDGPAFKMTEDPRITRVGKFLRRTCIDELPQLWNVIRGDMTLVGPRPLPVDEANGCTSWQERRLDITPGLTCIWQVYGKSKVSFAEWMRMDIRYKRFRSPGRDARLIARTLLSVILARASK